MSLEKPCKLWPGAIGSRGYGVTWHDGKTVSAHRREYEKHHGPIPKGMVVRHKCDNPPCYEITHLELGTHHQNSMDMVERGRARGGRPHTHSKGFKLVLADLVARGFSNTVIAAEMGCSTTFVQYVRNGGRRTKPDGRTSGSADRH
ncbi:MAG: HNH endonuclease [Mesorhizobium sp.]|nr:MAG: HNH endonuclease [Mesorhizobium sp.]